PASLFGRHRQLLQLTALPIPRNLEEELMKKMHKNFLASAVALSAMASLALTPAAHAEVSASVGASNMYYWRGLDLGGGAAISADINYSASGFFGGLWTSSGDEGWGTEYDIYAGYG